MGRKEESQRKKRMEQGNLQKRDVARRLAELAYARSNDCLKLTTGESLELDRLDLSLLQEFKRSGNGGVEIKLVDRMEVLELLAELAREESVDTESLLQTLLGS